MQIAVTAAVIIQQHGKYLMVEEKALTKLSCNHPEQTLVINQPAGHMEADENIQQAAIRECYEETGLQIELLSLIGIYQFMKHDGQKHYLRFCFSAQTLQPQQKAKPIDTDIVQCHWLTKQEILARKKQWRGDIVMQCIQDYESGQAIALDKMNFNSCLTNISTQT